LNVDTICVTAAEALSDPEEFVQVSVSVASFVIVTDSVPAAARDPVHPPLALQDVAFVEDHVATTAAPVDTSFRSTAIVTVGFGPEGVEGDDGDVGDPFDSPPPPPHASAPTTTATTIAGRNARTTGLSTPPSPSTCRSLPRSNSTSRC
jgi:hypothetical protein